MSAAVWEVIFNSICFGIAIAIGGFTIIMYRQFQPKFYGLLVYAFILTLGAAFTYGLYSDMLDAFLAMKSTGDDVLAAKTHLAENMRLLSFVVPGLMLAVAANLITAFLQAPTPGRNEHEL